MTNRASGHFRAGLMRGWRVALVGALTSLCLATMPATAAGKEPLVIVTSGGVFEQAMKKHFYDPFTEATGIEVIPVAAGLGQQWAKVKAMAAMPAAEWDIVTAVPSDTFAQADNLAALDCAAMPNVAGEAIANACMGNAMLRTWGGNVLAWNTKSFSAGKEPKSWKDFWDVENFPGPRSLPDAGYWSTLLMVALVADGVPADKLFPLDVDRALKKLEAIKPHITVWWKTADQSQNIIRSGEVVMALMGSGRVMSLVKAGEPVAFTWNGAPKDVGLWAVLKNAPNKPAAMEFVNFYLGNPEAHAAFTRDFTSETPNRRAIELVSPEERKTRGADPANLAVQIEPDWKWLAENEATVKQRVLELLSR